MKAFLSIFISFLLISCVAQQKLHWPDKHGPQWNGTVPDSASKGLPLKWGGEKEENIIWKTPLERLGHSTPVIAGKKIWFTSATEDGKQQFIYCLDSNTGKVIHHKLLFENSNPEPLGNTTNNYATPSCFLEEDAVYVHFGTFEVHFATFEVHFGTL